MPSQRSDMQEYYEDEYDKGDQHQGAAAPSPSNRSSGSKMSGTTAGESQRSRQPSQTTLPDASLRPEDSSSRRPRNPQVQASARSQSGAQYIPSASHRVFEYQSGRTLAVESSKRDAGLGEWVDPHIEMDEAMRMSLEHHQQERARASAPTEQEEQDLAEAMRKSVLTDKFKKMYDEQQQVLAQQLRAKRESGSSPASDSQPAENDAELAEVMERSMKTAEFESGSRHAVGQLEWGSPGQGPSRALGPSRSTPTGTTQRTDAGSSRIASESKRLESSSKAAGQSKSIMSPSQAAYQSGPSSTTGSTRAHTGNTPTSSRSTSKDTSSRSYQAAIVDRGKSRAVDASLRSIDENVEAEYAEYLKGQTVATTTKTRAPTQDLSRKTASANTDILSAASESVSMRPGPSQQSGSSRAPSDSSRHSGGVKAIEPAPNANTSTASRSTMTPSQGALVPGTSSSKPSTPSGRTPANAAPAVTLSEPSKRADSSSKKPSANTTVGSGTSVRSSPLDGVEASGSSSQRAGPRPSPGSSQANAGSSSSMRPDESQSASQHMLQLSRNQSASAAPGSSKASGSLKKT